MDPRAPLVIAVNTGDGYVRGTEWYTTRLGRHGIDTGGTSGFRTRGRVWMRKDDGIAMTGQRGSRKDGKIRMEMWAMYGRLRIW